MQSVYSPLLCRYFTHLRGIDLVGLALPLDSHSPRGVLEVTHEILLESFLSNFDLSLREKNSRECLRNEKSHTGISCLRRWL